MTGGGFISINCRTDSRKNFFKKEANKSAAIFTFATHFSTWAGLPNSVNEIAEKSLEATEGLPRENVLIELINMSSLAHCRCGSSTDLCFCATADAIQELQNDKKILIVAKLYPLHMLCVLLQ